MKTQHVASITLGESCDGMFDCEATGKTREEALRNLLDKLGKYIRHEIVEVGTEFQLPESIFAAMPKFLPEGTVRVCLVRHSHGSGEAYDWRHVAVPYGGQIRRPDGTLTKKVVRPTKIFFTDCNRHYHYGLPSGSSLWQDGAWISTEKVEYDY